ncbi:MAG TPA: hypothetical protein VL404_07825 [Candidatus Eisenbacteria bacterium]|nr:hypothetical protein [Candidatus Eisenbacteria bacterium]
MRRLFMTGTVALAVLLFPITGGAARAAQEGGEISFNDRADEQVARDQQREEERAAREEEKQQREEEKGAGSGVFPAPEPGHNAPGLPPALENPAPAPAPAPSMPEPGSGPSAGFPVPGDGGFATPAPSPGALQPTTQNQSPTNPMVSVYSQSSSSTWVIGDPFDATPDLPAEAPTSAAPSSFAATGTPSMTLFYTGTVVSTDRGSVTLKDRSHRIRTVYADAASVKPLKKGQQVRVGFVPGSSRAQSLQAA